ncbi:hypothetical protein ABTF11_18660, partial [Acinetobacter baumannii]
GQCLQQYGAGEAYLPILEALGRMCRGPDASEVIAVLTRCAPSWIAQMPWLDSAGTSEPGSATTQERMLREMVEALEFLAADRM